MLGYARHNNAANNPTSANPKNCRSVTDEMPSEWPFGAFACYTDPTLGPKQWQSQYYGENFSKLTTLHFKYDNNGLFNYPQGIPNPPLPNPLQPDLNMDLFNPTVQKLLNV